MPRIRILFLTAALALAAHAAEAQEAQETDPDDALIEARRAIAAQGLEEQFTAFGEQMAIARRRAFAMAYRATDWFENLDRASFARRNIFLPFTAFYHDARATIEIVQGKTNGHCGVIRVTVGNDADISLPHRQFLRPKLIKCLNNLTDGLPHPRPRS
jgi:phosphate-selective porin